MKLIDRMYKFIISIWPWYQMVELEEELEREYNKH